MPPPQRSAARPAAKPRTRHRPIGLAALRGFESSARLLSFTLAAGELNLTQSSISRQVSALERQIGKRLFTRRTRALELTDAGLRLYATVKAALGNVDRTVSEIRGVGGPPRVTVTTYASFASLWLVPRLPEFQRAHPGIDIRIDASDRMVDINAEGLDIAIRWVPPGLSIPPDAHLVSEEETNAALSPRLIASSGIELKAPADLGRLPILAMDESVPSTPYSSWAKWCEYVGIAPFEGAARLYFTYVDQSVQAAVRGQGVALVRTPFLDDLVAGNDLVTPFPNLRMPTGYRFFVLVNRDRARLPHVAAFRDWLVSEFARGPHRLT